ncbi:mannitol dehydrogenase family protein [Roseomonas elaeocarpi]|uniref:Mannitol dehydrogenase family protein n=1 Tax=Roseomonas elaeocarpi TaxID=907779 RepID=A0ABV6JV45_9PROT
MSGQIIQFGTSRFLQAHVAFFAHEARESGQHVGPITVVQTSGSAERAGRVDAFGTPYTVILRGSENGQAVERRTTVRSIAGGLAASRDWAALVALFAGDAEFVVSNTGDRGYEVAAEDRSAALLEGGVPRSFPGKLTALLWERWRRGGRPLTILPCELIPRNAAVLHGLVRELADAAGAPDGFRDWLDTLVIWADTLVDRIVSEPLDPIGAVAEPYALWAIEARPGLVLPFTHPAVVVTEALEPFERLKLHILNLGHTVLADLWLRDRRPEGETVRAILNDDAVREELLRLYRDEVLPGFARHGMGEDAERYVATTMDRFRNPFLDHRLADIAGNHAAKVERRLGAFRDWVATAPGAPLPMPGIEAVIARQTAPELVGGAA